MILKVPC